MEKILLGGHEFRAIRVINLSQSATTPEHRVEEQFSIVDHIILEPIEFRLELELLKDEGEVDKLNSLFEARQPIEFVCDLGVFEDMVIKSREFVEGGSVNTVRASVHIKQIRKAKAKTATIPLPIIQSEEDYPGSDTAVSPLQQQVPSAPEKQEEKSWLDSIFDWFGGLFGG